MTESSSENLKLLKERGGRLTPIRTALVELLEHHRTPLNPSQILQALRRNGQHVNKTTVYRQLEQLKISGVVSEVQFSDRTKRYEIIKDGHHHHTICLECGRVDDVNFPSDVEQLEKSILKKTRFKVERHTLEFFGRCVKCQKR